MQRHIVRPEGLAATSGYSHVAEFSGRLVAVSGQVAWDADGNVVGRDDVEVQARQVFANLGTALAAAGTDLAHVVKLTVFLTDIGDVATVRRVRNEFVDAASPPASTLVQVVALVDPALKIEVEALAVVEDA
jgi:enamine deaminase RidA (YjgF/YER057c/UK114 family)